MKLSDHTAEAGLSVIRMDRFLRVDPKRRQSRPGSRHNVSPVPSKERIYFLPGLQRFLPLTARLYFSKRSAVKYKKSTKDQLRKFLFVVLSVSADGVKPVLLPLTPMMDELLWNIHGSRHQTLKMFMTQFQHYGQG